MPFKCSAYLNVKSFEKESLLRFLGICAWISTSSSQTQARGRSDKFSCDGPEASASSAGPRLTRTPPPVTSSRANDTGQ